MTSAENVRVAASIASAARTIVTVGTHIAVYSDHRSETSPKIHDDGAVPTKCIVKITRPCAAALCAGGARSSTLTAIGACYHDMKNSVSQPVT